MGRYTLGTIDITREELCALLRGEEKCKLSNDKLNALAALWLERDIIKIGNMQNVIDGLKAKNNDLQNKLTSVNVILREKALRGGKWRR